MKKWGYIVTAYYVIVVLCLLIINWGSADAPFWVWLGILVGGEAMLLFLSVDTSVKKLKPRRHILLSVATIAIAFAMLTYAALASLYVTFFSDYKIAGRILLQSFAAYIILLLALWVFWGVIFYIYSKGKQDAITRLVAWLVNGSVLELLIAVPCHVIVRRRGDCCAIAVTGFGIATGIVVMLMAFGPSVLFLYKERLERYKRPVASEAFADEVEVVPRKCG
jgi:hypothetical protein